MNILFVHSYCFPTGGDWTYVSTIMNIFKEKKYKVSIFGIKKTESDDIQEDNCYVRAETFLYNKTKKRKLRESLINGINILFNLKIYLSLKKHLEKFKPEVIQLNSIHTALSPSVLLALIPYKRRYKCKILWRMIDYKIICPNRTLLDNFENKCTECIDKTLPYPVIIKRCKNNNLLESILVFTENSLMNILIKKLYIDKFLLQSEFSAELIRKSFLKEKNYSIIKNPTNEKNIYKQINKKEYDVIYFGRLSKEKGILQILPKLAQLGLRVVIIGNGPEEEEIRVISRDNDKIKFMGPVWGDELCKIINKSILTIVPSIWFEVSPYVVLDSYRCGVPVLVSDVGGTKDIVLEGVTGEIYDNASETDLEIKIKKMINNQELYKDDVIKNYLTQNHSYEKYYKEIKKEILE